MYLVTNEFDIIIIVTIIWLRFKQRYKSIA